MRVGTEKMALLGRHRSTFTVGDTGVGLQSSGFTAQCQMRSLFAGDGPRMKQIQIARLLGNQIFFRQSGHGVFGGEAGNIESRLNRAFDCSFGKVGGAGIAPAMTDIHRDAQRFVAVALDVF